MVKKVTFVPVLVAGFFDATSVVLSTFIRRIDLPYHA